MIRLLRAVALLASIFALNMCASEPDSSLGPEEPFFVASGNTVACGDWAAYVEDTSGFLVLGLIQTDTALPNQYGASVLAENGVPPKVEARLYRTGAQNALKRFFCNPIEPGDVTAYTLLPQSGIVYVRKYGFRGDSVQFAGFFLDLNLRGLSFQAVEMGKSFRIDSLRLDSLFAGWRPGPG